MLRYCCRQGMFQQIIIYVYCVAFLNLAPSFNRSSELVCTFMIFDTITLLGIELRV